MKLYQRKNIGTSLNSSSELQQCKEPEAKMNFEVLEHMAKTLGFIDDIIISDNTR